MEYRKFGKTGIDISAIGFGCWEIGGGYGSIEETDFIKAVNRALDVGINSFDTAEAYGFGASEKSLAKALGKRRKEAVITTKFGVGYPDTPNYRDSSRKRVMESIEKSLKALDTDYVDVYLIHWPDRNVPFEEPMRALDDLVKQGKVRAVGLSNFKLNEIEACMKARRVDVVQYCWNMFDRRMEKEIFPYCRRTQYRRDGLWLASLRDADRYPQRRESLRERRLAVAARQAGQHQLVPASVRARPLP